MKFYEPDLKYIGTGEYAPEMIENNAEGEWATRDDAEQLEKERNAYRDECIARGGRELQALCDKEQVEKERDEFERKCGELCQAHGTLLIKFHDAVKDAVEMARLAQREIVRRCSGKIGWVYEDDPGIQRSQSVIERYEGGEGK